MSTEDGREGARQYVRAFMSHRGWTPAGLARAAEIDPGTAGDFLNGVRWPKLTTLGKLEAVVGLPPGELSSMANGTSDHVEHLDALAALAGIGTLRASGPVGADVDDAFRVLLDAGEAFEGLSAIEREEAVTAAKLALLAKAREIRNRGH